MKNLKKAILITIYLLSMNILSPTTAATEATEAPTEAATTSTSSTSPATSITAILNPDFIASEFQLKISAAINDINIKIDDFLKNQEIINLNYGLHAVNFINEDSEVQLQNPAQQFMKDFARISCYSNYESKLPECNTTNDKSSQKTYGFLRPSNIFEALIDTPEEQALAALTVKTMIDPLPSTKLNEILSSSDLNEDAKQKEIASLIAAQAPITLAKNSLNEIIAKRTKFSGQPSSIMQIIKEESNRRIKKNWIESMKTLPMNHLILELLQIEAFKIWVDYHKFLQNERIEALIATLLASQTSNINKLINESEAQSNNAKKMANEKIKDIPGVSSESDVHSKLGF